MRRRFHILDVFTDTPFTGNPLAVVLDADAMSPARMQDVAREFNLSETVFVLEPRDPVNSARLRIFTPRAEMPFAGHPTVGAAALIAKLRAPDMLAREDLQLVLEEEIGSVVCNVRGAKGRPLHANFDIPRLPERLRDFSDMDAIASALNLLPGDIGFDSHRSSVWTAGNPLAFIPIATRQAIARAAPRAELFDAAFGEGVNGAYLYTTQCAREGSDVHARMFAPAHGIIEDPATGSAAAAFAGVAVAFEPAEDGAHSITIEQGFEMSRPSIIHLSLEVVDGALIAASVGGAVVSVAEGNIET